MTTPDWRRSGSGFRRGDLGLATLEWLLIVAAVAGLAALAVVLVQSQVEDTAEGISNPDARVTSAIHSAFSVESDAKGASAADFATWADWESRFRQRCSQIAVLYAAAKVQVVDNEFNGVTGGGSFDAAAAVIAAAADDRPPGTNKAQVQCVVQ